LPTDQRIALLRSESQALIKHGKITVTATRAKEIVKFIDPIITLSKKGDLSSRKLAAAKLVNKDAVKQLFQMAEKFSLREGGFTRATKVGLRKGDAAQLVLLEIL